MLVISDCIPTVQHMPSVLTEGPMTWSWQKLLFLKSKSGSKSSRWKLQQICILWTSVPVDETYASEQYSKPLKSIFFNFNQEKPEPTIGLFVLHDFLCFCRAKSEQRKYYQPYLHCCLPLSYNKDCYRRQKKWELHNKLARCNNFFSFLH